MTETIIQRLLKGRGCSGAMFLGGGDGRLSAAAAADQCVTKSIGAVHGDPVECRPSRAALGPVQLTLHNPSALPPTGSTSPEATAQPLSQLLPLDAAATIIHPFRASSRPNHRVSKAGLVTNPRRQAPVVSFQAPYARALTDLPT
jgi:hypothetical protein